MKLSCFVMGMISKLLAIPAVGLVILLGPALSLPLAAQEPRAAAADRASILAGFSKRVEAYMDLKKKLARGLPAVKPGAVSTGAVDTHETVLSTRIRDARADAKPGDVFGEAVPYFRTVIKNDTKTRGVADAYALMQEVPAKSPPKVNADYPDNSPLATVPPLILVNLPRLPDGLEYRFMGRDLILRDRTANLVVDFIEGAVPVIRR